MAKQHYLVIGARGFIGSWICRLLVEEGVKVTASDASPDPRSVDSVLSQKHIDNIDFRVADARDPDATTALIDDSVTHVVYLAGLLRPQSEQNPLMNSQVSVGGVINVMNASVKREGRLGIAYASTAAVYGSPSLYPGAKIDAESKPAPRDHYGVTRYTMEMLADVYARDNGVYSVGLRPWVVYGAGRFSGLTAQPSIAMLAAAANAPFEMKFGGRIIIHHGREVAKAFIEAARANVKSAVHANVPGDSVEMNDLIEIIYRAAPEARGKISASSNIIGGLQYLEDPRLEQIIGPLPPLTDERVRETVEDYKRLLKEKRIAYP